MLFAGGLFPSFNVLAALQENGFHVGSFGNVDIVFNDSYRNNRIADQGKSQESSDLLTAVAQYIAKQDMENLAKRASLLAKIVFPRVPF
jgi:hypothetical protein